MNDGTFDFRREAILASSAIATIGSDLPLDRSVCIANSLGSSDPFKWFGRFVLLRFVVGIGLLVAGGMLGLQSKHQENSTPRAVGGFACAVGGITILISSSIFQRRFARRMIALRYDDLVGLSAGFAPLCVEVEDASTFDKLKLVSEDVGYLGLDDRNQRVIIEGVRCRYSIHAADVVEVKQIEGGSASATKLSYDIGDVTHSIAVKSASIWHEVKRQLGVSKDPLIDRMRKTLEL